MLTISRVSSPPATAGTAGTAGTATALRFERSALDSAGVIGPNLALRAYLDLTAENSLSTYLALRDLHRRYRSEVELYVGVVSPTVIRGLEWRALGDFSAELAQEVELGVLLKEIARAPLLAQVDARTQSGRIRLATRMGLPEQDAERLATAFAAALESGRCPDDVLASMHRLRVDLSHQGLGVVRPPLFEILMADGRSELIAGDPNDPYPRLDSIASALERLLREHRRGPTDQRISPVTQSLPNRLSASVVNAGMVVGGIGLAHELTIFATAEDDGMMMGSLDEALAYRTLTPGRLGIRIVAAGQKPGTALFGKRLCAAGIIGESLAYARYLARPSSARGNVADLELLSRLDAVLECEDPSRSLPPLETGLYGTWLDGRGFDPREGLGLARLVGSEAMDEDALWQVWPGGAGR